MKIESPGDPSLTWQRVDVNSTSSCLNDYGTVSSAGTKRDVSRATVRRPPGVSIITTCNRQTCLTPAAGYLRSLRLVINARTCSKKFRQQEALTLSEKSLETSPSLFLWFFLLFFVFPFCNQVRFKHRGEGRILKSIVVCISKRVICMLMKTASVNSSIDRV